MARTQRRNGRCPAERLDIDGQFDVDRLLDPIIKLYLDLWQAEAGLKTYGPPWPT